MKKMAVALALAFLLPTLSGCAPRMLSLEHYGAFDTVIQITVAPRAGVDARAAAETAFAEFDRLHRLFDIYHEYAGLNNLCTLNRQAGSRPVALAAEALDLLEFGRQAFALSQGQVNMAMGSVLELWRGARETGRLPGREALEAAARHTDMATLQIDRADGTAFLSDPAARLDVGAIAKGWACQRVAERLDAEYPGLSYLISAGGNVLARGTRGGNPWRVGIQSPDDPGRQPEILALEDRSAVTSGGYQRFVEIDGRRYHHIISPETLMPGELARSVTIVHADSGLADMLSTACFLLPPREALALADAFEAGILIIDRDGAALHNTLLTGYLAAEGPAAGWADLEKSGFL